MSAEISKCTSINVVAEWTIKQCCLFLAAVIILDLMIDVFDLMHVKLCNPIYELQVYHIIVKNKVNILVGIHILYKHKANCVW